MRGIHQQNLSPRRSPYFFFYPQHQIEVALCADVSKNTLPFGAVSENNLTRINKPQTLD